MDYHRCSPSQYWHLMTYCDSKNPDDKFQSVVCGELIFWMAEVLGCVNRQEVEKLLNEILESTTPSEKRPIYDRLKWNKRIHDLCYDKIETAIMGTHGGKDGARKRTNKIDWKKELEERDICVMYGCPEVLFSPKEKAEKLIREEGEVNNTSGTNGYVNF